MNPIRDAQPTDLRASFAFVTRALSWLAIAAACSCSALAPGELDLRGPVSDGPDADAPVSPDAEAAGGGADASLPSTEAFIVIEAEHYDARDDQRLSTGWYRIPDTVAPPTPDPDPPHVADASGGAYVEVLPDRRVTDRDSTTNALWETPGDGPLIHFYVHFPRVGDYKIWIRGYSTGTEDETVHLALDKDWKNARTAKLCSASDGYQWASQERTDKFSCGDLGTLSIRVPTEGNHTITFAAREDGFELDKWIMTTDRAFLPRGVGPDEVRP